MKKSFLIALILSVGILAGCSSKNTTATTGTWSENSNIPAISLYENKENNFSIKYPSERTFKENIYGSKVMFFSPQKDKNTTRENFWITIQQIASGNLQSFYDKNKEMIGTNSKIESEEDITINKQPAKKIIYSFAQGDYDIKEAQYLFINEKSAYIFTYIALKKTFNTYKDAVETMAKSFTLK